MEKRAMAYWIAGVVVLAVIFMIGFAGDEVEAPVEDIVSAPEPAPISTPVPTAPEVDVVVDWERYNYDYVDADVKGILNGMLGANGKTAFYLPATGYVNVSRGSEYGVAYALNNPVPSGEDRFVFNWTAGSEDCGVGLDVAQGWIERGSYSWGKIPKGWIDHMTVYFSFPADVEACSVTYDFVILKDGVLYDSRTLEFNLV